MLMDRDGNTSTVNIISSMISQRQEQCTRYCSVVQKQSHQVLSWLTKFLVKLQQSDASNVSLENTRLCGKAFDEWWKFQ